MAFGSTGSIHADVAVVDLDGGPVAAGVTTFVRGPDLAGLRTVKPVTSEADARAKVASGDLSAAFVIPSGYSAAVTAGSARPITVLASVDASVAEQVARSLAQSYTVQIEAAGLLAQAAVRAGAPHSSAAALAAEASAVRLPAQTVTRPAGTRALTGTSYYAPAMGIFLHVLHHRLRSTRLLPGTHRRDPGAARCLPDRARGHSGRQVPGHLRLRGGQSRHRRGGHHPGLGRAVGTAAGRHRPGRRRRLDRRAGPPDSDPWLRPERRGSGLRAATTGDDP